MPEESSLSYVARCPFVVYGPPAAGLPWLAICLGPDRLVHGAETFKTEAAARDCAKRCAGDFKRASNTRSAQVVQFTSPASDLTMQRINSVKQ